MIFIIYIYKERERERLLKEIPPKTLSTKRVDRLEIAIVISHKS